MPSMLEKIHGGTLSQPNSIPDVSLSQSESSGLTFDTGAAVCLSRFHTLVTVTPLSWLQFQHTDSDLVWLHSANHLLVKILKIKGSHQTGTYGNEQTELTKGEDQFQKKENGR